MKQGVIIYSSGNDSVDIRFDIDTFYGGLHCGQCFDVLVHGRWMPTRLEKSDLWYLVGLPPTPLTGIRIRIDC